VLSRLSLCLLLMSALAKLSSMIFLFKLGLEGIWVYPEGFLHAMVVLLALAGVRCLGSIESMTLEVLILYLTDR